MSEWTVERAASVLLEAEAARTDRPPITDEWPGLDLATAYAVQDETLRRRLARGWMSRSRGTGAPAGSTIASVSQAVSGEPMFIRCCLARLVSPSLSPTNRPPRSTAAPAAAGSRTLSLIHI